MVLHSDAKKLLEPEEPYKKGQNESLLDKFRIPVQHFEYSYIEKCKDGRELEKIVQVLRSGEEGYFPDLTRFAEDRLTVIKPKSKLLRIATPVLSKENLSRDEQNEIKNDLQKWISTVVEDDNELVYFKNRQLSSDTPPEVRKSQQKNYKNNKKTVKRISSTDYSSWDKYDADTEILKMDLEEENLKRAALEKEKTKPKKTVQFKKFTTDVEACREATYEKDKGNEFFKAGDYEEALRHYTNSINYKGTVVGFTNRALTNIKLKNFKSAIADCQSALTIEPNNVKALLRKAQALNSIDQHNEALECVELAIKIDPNNTVSQELAEKIRKTCGAAPQGSTRFLVEEIDQCKNIQKTNKDKRIERNERNGLSNRRENKEKLIIPIAGTSNMAPPHYIACSDSNPEEVKQQTVKANTPTQIVHLVSLDHSDIEDDDGCTINHLKRICSSEKINKKTEGIHSNKNENHNNEQQNISIKTENISKQKKVFRSQEFREDKHAGGEPCIKEDDLDVNTNEIHSPYCFLRTWNSANVDKTYEQHASILRSMDMNRIVQVIGCKLDNSMLSTILKCLCIHFAVPGEVDRLQFILENMVNLPRFDIIAMLMSTEDRTNVNTLVNFLKQHGKPLPQSVINKFL